MGKVNMKKKIIYIVTVPKSLKLLTGLLPYLQNNGFETNVITSPGDEIIRFEEQENTKVLPAEMKREISLFQDLFSLIKLIRIIAKEKPLIVNSGTPKAGLLGTLASFICRVPIRIYTIRGLRLETSRGFKRKILLFTEKLASKTSTHVVCISPSLRDQVVALGITHFDKISILGKGSSNGINVEKIQNTRYSNISLKEFKDKLNISSEDFVIGFVGRLTNDKGINEVIEVFEKIKSQSRAVKLLILGDFDEGDSISEETIEKLRHHPRIIFEGYKENLTPYYQLMDIFLFLSKREGFGNVVIEAALNKVPAIVGNVTGVKDTVINNKTGFVINIDDLNHCVKLVEYLMEYENEIVRLGTNAESWAKHNFNSNYIWGEYTTFYKKLLESSR